MKKVVEPIASMYFVGVAAELYVDGTNGENKFGKNWKFKYFKFNRKFEQLYGRSSITKQWKYMCWNTYVTNNKGYAPLNNKINSTTRAI